MNNFFTGLTGGSVAPGINLTEAQQINMNIGKGLNSGLNMAYGISNGINASRNSTLTNTSNQFTDMASDAMMKVNPAVGGAMKALSFIGSTSQALGMRTDQLTTADKIFGNNLIAGTPIGMINNAFTTKTKDFSLDQNLQQSSSFTGSALAANNAKGYAGKKLGLFSRGAKKGFNAKIDNASMQQNTFSKIKDENDMAMANLGNIQNLSNSLKMQNSGGYKPIEFGKKGLKFQELKKLREDKSKLPKEKPKSVIVEGALHARKHNLDKLHEDLKGEITLKGIPVISKESDGGIVQHAEVERQELIMHKELTDQLMELYKDGSEQAMIKAGKILAKELITNTIDNTGEILKTDEDVDVQC